YSRAEIEAGHTNPQSITHPDEFNIVARAYQMVTFRRPNPDFFEQPSLFIYLNAAMNVLSGDTAAFSVSPTIGQREIAPFSVYVVGRVLAALMAILGVAFIYAAGRWLFGETAGLLAALILTV